MDVRKQEHAMYHTQYHIVWCTRFRRKILVKGVDRYLRIKLLESRKYYPDWEFLEIGMDRDHIHLYMIIPPKYAISDVINTLKSNTSRHIRKKYAFLKHVYWDTKGIWSTGYFVSTVGLNEFALRKYIEMQGQEDAGQAQLAMWQTVPPGTEGPRP